MPPIDFAIYIAHAPNNWESLRSFSIGISCTASTGRVELLGYSWATPVIRYL